MLLLIAALSSFKVGARPAYIAMPKSPAFTNALGKTVPPSRIVFHELTLTGTDTNGTRHFLLDGRAPVKCTAPNIVRKDGLRLEVMSPELTALRRKYVGHDFWIFGSWHMAREPLTGGEPFGEPFDWKPNAGERIRIARIFELARAPVECRNYGVDHNGFAIDYTVDDDVLRARPGDQIFLFLYAPSAATKPTSSYTAAYNLFIGDWFLDQAFSPTPPSLTVQRAIRRFHATRLSAHPYLAKSHIEAAWIYGWPMERKPLEVILREQRWSDNHYYSVDFKGDRVVSYYRR